MRTTETGGSRRLFLALVLWLALVNFHGYAGEERGPVDQFQSVIYVRKRGASDEMYRALKPHTGMALPPLEGLDSLKYRYNWFNPCYVLFKNVPVPDPADPYALVEGFSREMWEEWDKFRAAGVVSGERPAKFEDLCFMSEQYALAVRDGTQPPERVVKRNNEGRAYSILCISNPEVRRITTDLMKFNAAHGLANGRNGGFVDLDWIPSNQDFSEYSRAKFEAWLRANYTRKEIERILQVDVANPIPILTPKGAGADAARAFRCLRQQFWNNNWAEHAQAVKEAIDSVLGAGKFHFIYHGDGYGWRSDYMNMVWWGDWMDSYCTECARWPGVRRGAIFYNHPLQCQTEVA